jgi:pyruvate kinase
MKPPSKFRRTKIVCTIGPASDTPEKIRDLISAGMDVARLNFSHGDHETHRRTIRAIRTVAREFGKEIGILQDLGGPKIRLGNLLAGVRKLEVGEEVVLSPGEESATEVIPVAYAYLLQDIEIGNRILLADGTIELLVMDKKEGKIICKVLVGGMIMSHKGVNLPTSTLRIPAFTEKDRQDLCVGLEERVDFVALSFVRHEVDLDPVLQILDQVKRRPMLIAKIEKPQAVERVEKILAEVDGIMIARGDLGVEMPLEEVPIIQKSVIRMARRAGKPVITATQMLTSMMRSPRPTRAEATDVANAILDGTDAVMLSEETAAGAYIKEAVSTLDRIARATEPYMDEQAFMEETTPEPLPATPAAISRAACWLARDLGAAAIVASTSSGTTARLVARFRPLTPIVALTNHPQVQRQLALSWGVIPDLVEAFIDTDQMFASARASALDRGIAKHGDRLIITAGVPVGVRGTTNLLKVMELLAEDVK